MTRAQLQEMVFNKEAVSTILSTLTQTAADVLVVAGTTTPASELFMTLKERFRGRMEVLPLSTATVSLPVFTVSVRHGERFNKDFMEDANAFEPSLVMEEGASVVLCLNEIGLRRVVRKQEEGSSGTEASLLLKPKVVLDSSSTDDVIAEDQPVGKEK